MSGVHLVGQQDNAIGMMRLQIAQSVLPLLAAIDYFMAARENAAKKESFDQEGAEETVCHPGLVGQLAMTYADNLLVAAGVIRVEKKP
jgi:hypothetical protein